MAIAVNDELKKAWDTLKSENPQLRIRNAAAALEVSELELLITGLGRGVTLLENRFGELLQALESVGTVMALSRNEQVVHEKHGIYTDFKVTGKGQMGICLGDIDLRVFFNQWQHAFSVSETTRDVTRQSIQFFDQSGTAIHKIYQTDRTDPTAWETLISDFTEKNQKREIHLPSSTSPETSESEHKEEPTPEAVRTEWAALKDVHHFNAMLKRLGINRYRALELVGNEYAQQLSNESAEQALTLAQEKEVPVMVFVGNNGIVQIHTGKVEKLVRTGSWFNVLDPDFNLHLNTGDIFATWLVRRPSSDGDITSIEVYNSSKEIVLTLFGERKPGQEEIPEWRKLVADVENGKCCD